MASHPEFDSTATATQVAATFGPQIKGKTVVITGISPEGIGSATALAIASQAPATVILASRTQSKLTAVVAEIAAKYPAVQVKSVTLDLASIESINSAAADINSLVDHIDVLINNAGLTMQTRNPVKTPGGTTVDLQFFINHLGTFLFTSLLLPKVVAAGPRGPKGSARVVNLASHGHRLSPVRFSDYAFERDANDVPDSEKPPANIPEVFSTVKDGYPGFLAYGQSKGANILHAMELNSRMKKAGTGVLAVSVHPGTIATELSRDLDPSGKAAIDGTAPAGQFKSLDQGAATTIVGAFDPKLAEAEVPGPMYLSDCQYHTERLAKHATDKASAEKLWAESERMLGIKCL